MSSPGIVDVHSHLVPGVDDGARSREEALTAIARLVDEGVTGIVTTPHIDASFILREEAFLRVRGKVEEAWAGVAAVARERFPRLRLDLGREVMLDSPTPRLEDPSVRLAGGPYVLVEFPRLNIPPASEDALYRIRSDGYWPVVAHVERYHFHGDPLPRLEEWRDAGAALQVNLGSLLGTFGNSARQLAWRLLAEGWVELLASDYHARGEPRIAAARDAVLGRGGERAWELMTKVNPRRILVGDPLTPVPAVEASRPDEGPFRRVLRRLRGSTSRSSV